MYRAVPRALPIVVLEKRYDAGAKALQAKAATRLTLPERTP